MNITMNNMSAEEIEENLVRLNKEELVRLIPLLVYLVIIAATGIPGNIIVCFSFRSSAKKSSSRFFIWWLAILDTVSCFVLFLEMINVVHQFDYPNEALCKITIFSTLVPVVSSGLSLCLISIDRFRRVCSPLKEQISVSTAKKMCAITTAVALFFSWPSLIFFGINDVPVPGTNLTGRECTVQNMYQNATETRLYQSSLWLLFIATLVFLTVVYTRILKRIFGQMNAFTFRTKSTEDNPVADTSTETSTGPSNVSEQNLSRRPSNVSIKQMSYIVSGTASTLELKHNSSRRDRSSHRQIQARKTAIVMFIISLVFVVSFLPYLILRAFEAFNETFLSSMSNSGRAVYKSFLRSYFLNCAINPVIYCACAETYREEIRRYFRRVRIKFRRSLN